PDFTQCVTANPNGSGQLTLSFAPISGFHLGVIGAWSFQGLPAGLSVQPASGSGSTLPTFTFTNSNLTGTQGDVQPFTLHVTLQNSLATVTEDFQVFADMSGPAGNFCARLGGVAQLGRGTYGDVTNAASLRALGG